MNCLICDKKLVVNKIFKNVDEMQEVHFLLCHPVCRKLKEKELKIKNEILNLEYRMKIKQIELLEVMNKYSDI